MFKFLKNDIKQAKTEYEEGVALKLRYRYILIGVATLIAAALFVVLCWHIIDDITDNRILKPGEVDFANEHTPVFIDPSSEEYYYDSGLFAPAVVADITKLYSGYIIDNGPIANIIKNYCVPFFNANDADPQFLLSFGIWEALNEDVYKSKGVVEENNKIYISYEVVDAAIKEYFEVDKLPFHADSVEKFGIFTADEKRQAYKADTTGFEDSLVGRVVSVTSESKETKLKDKDEKVITTYIDLTVDCISSFEQLEYEMESGKKPEVRGTYTIKIRVDADGSYKFLSIIDLNAKEPETTEENIN